MAPSGFGKRNAEGQGRSRKGLFDKLSVVTASVANYIDRLPEGSDIGQKTMSNQMTYGRQRIANALRELSAAGHLRLVRKRTARGEHVTHTYWSAVPRDDLWWTGWLSGAADFDPWQETSPPQEPNEAPEPTEAQGFQEPQGPGRLGEPDGSALLRHGYRVLARLGRIESQLTLSHLECVAHAPLVAHWLRRGASTNDVVRALSTSLPPNGVHAPFNFLEKRLRDRMPPVLDPEDELEVPARAVVECTDCRLPGRPHIMLGGLCRSCRDERPPAPARDGDRLTPGQVRSRAQEARAGIVKPVHRRPVTQLMT